MFIKNSILYIICFSFIIGINSYSQDLKAGEINIKNISGKTYEATVRLYQHIPKLVNRPFVLLNWGDGSPLDTLPSAGTGTCGDSNTVVNKYIGTHTYSYWGNYIISCLDSFRISNIQNINNSSNEKIYLKYHLIDSVFWGVNNSPVFVNCAIDIWQCCGWNYNPGAYDADGDSLSYFLVTPFTTNYTFPPESPITTGNYALCMRIDEWRNINQNSYQIGSTFRQILILVNSLSSVQENIFRNQISISPNPTTGKFQITGSQYPVTNIVIHNPFGQTIFQSSNINPLSNINLTSQPNGIYFLTATINGQPYTIKIIKI